MFSRLWHPICLKAHLSQLLMHLDQSSYLSTMCMYTCGHWRNVSTRSTWKEQKELKSLSLSFFLLVVYTMRSWLMALVMFGGQKSLVYSIQEDLWIGSSGGGRTHDVISCVHRGRSYCFFRHYSHIILRCGGGLALKMHYFCPEQWEDSPPSGEAV